jgi:retron-type reverse transcriptase
LGLKLEVEEPIEVHSNVIPETANTDSANGCKSERSLLEAILSVDNIFDAAERVISKKGAAGVDGMTVGELNKYLIKHYQELCVGL